VIDSASTSEAPTHKSPGPLLQENAIITTPPKSPVLEREPLIPALYAESALAKIWGVALRGLAQVSRPRVMELNRAARHGGASS
jgi:hypothetical protein